MRVKFIILISLTFLLSYGAKAQINIQHYLIQGHNDFVNYNYTDAIKRFNTIISVKPDLLEAYYYRGLAKYNLGDYNGAKSDFNKVVELNPYYAEGYRLRGLTKAINQDMQDAIVDLDYAILLDPAGIDNHITRGELHLWLGEFQLAIKDFSNASIIDNEIPRIFLGRGKAYYFMDNYNEALNDMSRYIQLTPFNSEGFIYRAEIFAKIDSLNLAINDLTQAIKVEDNDPELYFKRGFYNYRAGTYEEALLDLDIALNLDNNYLDAMYIRAMVLSILEKYYEAISEYDRIIDYDSDQAIIYYWKANCYSELDNVSQAILNLEKAIELDSTSATYYFELGNNYLDIQNFNLAIKNYESALEYNPENFKTNFNCGLAYQAGLDHESAIKYFSEAIKLFPVYAMAYKYRAESKRILGDEYGAIEDERIVKENLMKYESILTDSTIDVKTYLDSVYGFSRHSDFKFVNEIPNFKKQVDTIKEIVIDLKPILLVTNKQETLPREKFAFYLESLENLNRKNPLKVDYTIASELGDFTVDSVRQLLNVTEQEKIVSALDYYLYFQQGLLNSMIQNYNQSIKAYTTAIGFEPDFELAYFNRANTRYLMVEYINSMPDFTQVVTIEGKATTVQDEPGQVSQDEVYKDIIADLDKAINLNPNFGFAYYNRGNVKCMTKDFTGAIDDYTNALNVGPEMPQAYFNRGLTLIYLQDKEKGCLDMSKAGELGIEDAYPVIKKYCQKDED